MGMIDVTSFHGRIWVFTDDPQNDAAIPCMLPNVRNWMSENIPEVDSMMQEDPDGRVLAIFRADDERDATRAGCAFKLRWL